MANIRIKDQPLDTALSPGDLIIVDSEEAGAGTRKFDLGQKLEWIDSDIDEIKLDLANVGLSEDVKQALLQIALKVVYIDSNGQEYYDDLYDALYPPINLTSISAVYTQSGTVYPSDSLNSLKADLVVTAYYDDGTSEEINDYSLSGTLQEGTSTIGVTYYNKSTTFTVNVSAEPLTITNTLSHCSNSNVLTEIDLGDSYTGTITADNGYYLDDTDITVTMDGVDVTSDVLSSGVITISEVTGNIVITASATDALYPLKNGTFTFSNGNRITVTKHNHVEIELVESLKGWVDISDVSENTSRWDTVENLQNHNKKFTIPSGTQAIFTISNYIHNTTGDGACAFNLYNTTNASIAGFAIADLKNPTGSSTVNVNSNTDVGCIFAVPTFDGTYSFDVSLTVGGIKYV